MQSLDDQVVPTNRQIGRYRLDDIVAGDAGGSMWCAVDTTLNRTVAIRLVPVTDPRVSALRAAAYAAAVVVDRRIVRVFDVFDTEQVLVIVTEWVDGLTLGDMAHTPMPPGRSVRIAREVADAVAAIAATGTAHGRITPSCIVISDDGELRLRGHGIDAALWGVAPGSSAAAADVFCVGAVLMACLTSRWATGPVDGMRGAPLVGGVTATPSQLIADVPSELESIVCRAMAVVPSSNAVSSRNTGVVGPPIVDITALIGELALAQDQSLPLHHEVARTERPHIVRRSIAIVAAVAIVTLLGIVGASMLTLSQPNDRGAVGAAPNNSRDQAPTSPPNSSKAAINDPANPVLPAAAPAVERALPIAAARSFDPFGDGADNSSEVNKAFDTDLLSVWPTNVYKTANLDDKQGIGLILDLGAARQVSAVNLGLLGNNTDVQVRLSNDRLEPMSKKVINTLPIFGNAVGAPGDVSLRVPRPQTARYVVVWLTRLSWAIGGYQGGISNVSIRGS